MEINWLRIILSHACLQHLNRFSLFLSCQNVHCDVLICTLKHIYMLRIQKNFTTQFSISRLEKNNDFGQNGGWFMIFFKIIFPAPILAYTQGLCKSNQIGTVGFVLALSSHHTTNKHTNTQTLTTFLDSGI